MGSVRTISPRRSAPTQGWTWYWRENVADVLLRGGQVRTGGMLSSWAAPGTQLLHEKEVCSPEGVGDLFKLVLLLPVLHIQPSILGRPNDTVPHHDRVLRLCPGGPSEVRSRVDGSSASRHESFAPIPAHPCGTHVKRVGIVSNYVGKDLLRVPVEQGRQVWFDAWAHGRKERMRRGRRESGPRMASGAGRERPRVLTSFQVELDERILSFLRSSLVLRAPEDHVEMRHFERRRTDRSRDHEGGSRDCCEQCQQHRRGQSSAWRARERRGQSRSAVGRGGSAGTAARPLRAQD